MILGGWWGSAERTARTAPSVDTKGRSKGCAVQSVPAADFSRIRNANLERFTVDRLMIILDKMGREVEVDVRVLEAA